LHFLRNEIDHLLLDHNTFSGLIFSALLGGETESFGSRPFYYWTNCLPDVESMFRILGEKNMGSITGSVKKRTAPHPTHSRRSSRGGIDRERSTGIGTSDTFAALTMASRPKALRKCSGVSPIHIAKAEEKVSR